MRATSPGPIASEAIASCAGKRRRFAFAAGFILALVQMRGNAVEDLLRIASQVFSSPPARRIDEPRDVDVLRFIAPAQINTRQLTNNGPSICAGFAMLANCLPPALEHLGMHDMAQEKGFAPGVWDRLMEASEAPASNRTVQAMTLEQLKASVARDLEALLNTRVAIPEDELSLYPRCRASVLNYGVRDFAGMCLTSSEDRKIICDYLRVAIQCYEPRLANVRARVVMEPGVLNRLDFVIFGTLNYPGAAGRVEFNATLQPSTLHYSITPSGRRAIAVKEAA